MSKRVSYTHHSDGTTTRRTTYTSKNGTRHTYTEKVDRKKELKLKLITWGVIAIIALILILK